MTVEIRPYGDKCNLRCKYCYENPLRDHSRPDKPNYKAIKKALKQHNEMFTVFGGEPLTIPIDELEDIWKFGQENWKQNGIQTNASMMTSQHIALFKQYNVHVGVSIDGPRMLNDARCVPSGKLNVTRRMTNTSCKNLLLLLEENIPTSLICTLSQMNACSERLPRLIDWFYELESAGLIHIRIHPMENNDADELVLNDKELTYAFTTLYEVSKYSKLKFDLFGEMEERLRTGKGGSCVFNGCDPYNTRAVKGVGPRGELHNCGRINKEGIDFLKADEYIPIRSYILQNTEQSEGGCKGCRYWYACTGNCPGTGINQDWRNRTSHCSALEALFELIAMDKDIKLLEGSIQSVCNQDHVDKHGNIHANTPHGNVPHTNIIHLPRLEVKK